MKKIFFLIVMITGFSKLLPAQKTADRFTLNGILAGQNDGLLYLYYSDKDDKRIKDSAVIMNGKFSFKGNTHEPTMAYLQLKEEGRSEENSTGFFIEPAVMSATISAGKFQDGTFTGSNTQNEYASLETKKRLLYKRWKIVMDTLREVNKRSNVQFQELKDWVLQPFNAEINELDYAFFKAHPQSYVTAYLLRFHINDLSIDSLQAYYNNLGDRQQKTANGKNIADEIQKLRGGSPGSMAKNFSTTDINGNKINLNDFKGRYVLLDFWASWCVPCRKGNPHMRELYSKYKNKGIEFISVSDDDQKPEAWKKAVAMDSLPWRHVLRGLDMEKIMKNEPNSRDISEQFGISSLPTKILIDPQGKIIGRFDESAAGTDDDMDKRLGSIFIK